MLCLEFVTISKGFIVAQLVQESVGHEGECTKEDVIEWRLKLEAWWQAYGHFTKERSTDRRSWWFTEDRLRKGGQSAPRRATEQARAGQDGHDTPERIRTFLPITP
ncbi:hypothetical protein D9V28_07195 [Mycetocola zhadangensis]|uniref:Uncharacterized protein n=1 Tax=Mycetocola zhadangensis TaxID=1164595 RepID=A0A3L7J0T0_9MICO|nr:hypothetical protein D9V28_07195 [Mycetocola zhadangensis]GGE96808.1 hypothetical protein GCM10011313_19780 [Mycetocola zhadangensis]